MVFASGMCHSHGPQEAPEGSRWYRMYWQGLFYTDLDVRTGPWRHQQACVSNMINMVLMPGKIFFWRESQLSFQCKEMNSAKHLLQFYIFMACSACVHTERENVGSHLSQSISVTGSETLQLQEGTGWVPKEVAHDWGRWISRKGWFLVKAWLPEFNLQNLW